MKNLLSIITLTAFAACLPAVSLAAEKKAAAPASETPTEPGKKAVDKPSEAVETASEAKLISYRGVVAAVDASAKTFTFKNKDGKERVFTTGETTKIMKDDKSADFGAITVGSYATGSYKKGAEGKMDVVKVTIGTKPEPKAAAEATPASAEDKPKVGKPEAQPKPKAN